MSDISTRYSFEDDEFITYKVPKALLANTEFINEHQLDNDCIAILGRLIPLSKKGEIQISRQTLARQTCFRSKGDKAQLFRKISNTLSKLKASGLINIRKDTQLTELYKKQINFISVNPIWDNFNTSKNATNTDIKQEKCTSVKNCTSVNINTNAENDTSAENNTILVQNSACTSAENYTILVQKTDHYSKNIVSNSKNIVKDQIPQKIFNKFKDKNFYDLKAMSLQTCHDVIKSLDVTHNTCFYVNKTKDGYIFNKDKWEPYLKGIKSMYESRGFSLRHPLELLINYPDALETKLTLVLNDILTPLAVLALKAKFKITEGEEDSFGGLANAIMVKYQNQFSQQKLELWECVQDYVLKQVKAELATKHDLIVDELFNNFTFDNLQVNLRKVYEDGHVANPFVGIDLCYSDLMPFEQLFHKPIFTKFLLEKAMFAITAEAYHCEQWQQINQILPTFNDYLKDICEFQLTIDLDFIVQRYPEVLENDIYI